MSVETPHPVAAVARWSHPVLEASGVGVTFQGAPPVIAVENVTLALSPGMVTGVLGESGSGKSQLARALTRLTPGRVSGRVTMGGHDLMEQPDAALDKIRGARIGYVFQDPMSALHPFLTIGVQLAEVVVTHQGLSWVEARRRAIEMLERVGLPQAKAALDRHPHELSGGQRQRVVIAMALMAGPDVLIADEPTTALDATVQVHVLDLLREVCDRDGVALMLITHDIGVLARIADRVLVLYAGRMAEEGPAVEILTDPRHPYTRGLIDSRPDATRPDATRSGGIPGGLPQPGAPRVRCLFSPRCPRAVDRCHREKPAMTEADGRRFACFRPLEAAA